MYCTLSGLPASPEWAAAACPPAVEGHGGHEARAAAVEQLTLMASDDGAARRRKTPRADTPTTAGSGGDSLTDIEETIQGAFHFLDGPADVLSAATVCRRWHALACAGSVWWVKAEREGILDKAAAFEVEVPMVQEGSLEDEDEERATMAFYARVFVLKVRGRLSVSHGGGLARCANIQPSHRCSSPA